jgi:hypothetical protein
MANILYGITIQSPFFPITASGSCAI